jgi:ABC-2 type transport system permease protein
MGWLPIFKKEMRLYFGSPMAYVVGVFFLVITGWFFAQIFFYYTGASMQAAMNPAMGGGGLNPTENIMRPLFSNMSVVLLFVMPMVTMRLFAEEQKSGTIELLLTYPVRDGEVLFGKYLAAFVLFAILLAFTLLYPGLVMHFGRLEWATVLTGYLGLLLLGGAFLAIGVFLSCLTENQIVAAFSTFGVLLGLWVIGWGADFAGGTWRSVLQYVSVAEHLDGLAKGVVDMKDLVYYASIIALGLFLALRALEAKRWKG